MFFIIRLSASIRNSICRFSPTLNVLVTSESWYVAFIVQIPLGKSFPIFSDVSSFEFTWLTISFLCNASFSVYVTSFCVSVPFSNRIILNMISSPGLYSPAFNPEMSIENSWAEMNVVAKSINDNTTSIVFPSPMFILIRDSI